MRRVHPIFRFLATAFLVLVLGVGTNFGVAWALSYRAEGHIASWGREDTYTLGWTDTQNQRAVATAFEKRWAGVTYIRIFRRAIDDRYAVDPRPAAEVAPKWGAREVDLVARSTPPLPDKSDDVPLDFLRDRIDSEMFVAAGWPCRAFWCHGKAAFTSNLAAYPGDAEWEGPGVEPNVAGAFEVPRGDRAADDGTSLMQPSGLVVPLPYRLLWEGAAINTGVYSAAWVLVFMLVRAPWSIRRFLRRRRNLCLKCAYDLRDTPSGAPCPECGTMRLERVAPTPRARRVRRLLRLSFLAAFLGTMTIVAVAWSCALWVDIWRVEKVSASTDVVTIAPPFEGWLDVAKWRCPGAAFYESRTYTRWVPGMHIERDPSPENENILPILAMVEPWAYTIVTPWLFNRAPWPRDSIWRMPMEWRVVDARGWPFLCLWHGYGSEEGSVSGGIVLPGRVVPKGTFGNPHEVALPYFPIWRGLVLNMLIYSSFWMLLLFMPGFIRRQVRRRRKRCLKCAYDLRGTPAGSPCPECGVC